MRKLRNPRYAPESLERKLSPSQIASDLVPTALVVSLNSTLTLAGNPPTDPGTGLPPDPSDPTMPVTPPI